MQLQQTGAKPHYVDTDSVIFSCTKKQFNGLNLPIGLSFGKLKEDIKGAKYQNYHSLGPKRLNMCYKIDGKIFQKGKFSGLSHDQICKGFKMIDSVKMADILKYSKKFVTAQWRRKWMSKSNKWPKILTKYTLSVKRLGQNRIPIKGKKNIGSVPIGHSKSMRQKITKL